MNKNKIRAKVLREIRGSFKEHMDLAKAPHDIKVSAMDFYYSEIYEFVEEAIDLTMEAVQIAFEDTKKK